MTPSRTLAALACLAAIVAPLSACGDARSSGGAAGGEPFELPVGPTTWDATAPAWLSDGRVHVGERSVRIDPDADSYVVGLTGVYWMREGTLMFTSAGGDTQDVAPIGPTSSPAVSADHRVLAVVDRSRGPVDEYGTHVAQVAVFDTGTGEQLYRTPDEAPEKGADLTDLYEELPPEVLGVSDTEVFFDERTIDIASGDETPSTGDGESATGGYAGMADTLFTDGYRVGITGEGRVRSLAGDALYGTGRLSPDRTTVFDVSQSPTAAVVYDARTGRQRTIRTPWGHFALAGFTDRDTFYGVSADIDQSPDDTTYKAEQVVSCELRTLACTPVSPVVTIDPDADYDAPTRLRMPGGGLGF